VRPPHRIVLRGEDLIDIAQVAQQITLDDTRETRLEKTMDRIRDNFGPHAVGPATAFRRAS
jgi:DNA polymerase-4